MKLYLAAIYTSRFSMHSQLFHRLTPREQLARSDVDYYLESYHYLYNQSLVEMVRRDERKVFLDSGAFSAFTKGAAVDLPAYCDYIKRNNDIIARDDGTLLASVLDGIGDPLLTYQNQQHMEHLGVKPLPCFHYGEDERYLEYYMANYDYITLGGMVPISKPQLILWLDRIWDRYLTDGNGVPKLKVHGFGLTTQNLMERYPWYSIDSSTWVQNASMGMVFLPGIGGIPVSSLSPDRHNKGRHLDNMSEIHRQRLLDVIAEQGFDNDRLRDNYLARWAFNCWSFTQRGRLLRDKPPLPNKANEIGLF